jgi:hypothetical protein
MMVGMTVIAATVVVRVGVFVGVVEKLKKRGVLGYMWKYRRVFYILLKRCFGHER